jgi:serine/threonine protein kinase
MKLLINYFILSFFVALNAIAADTVEVRSLKNQYVGELQNKLILQNKYEEQVPGKLPFKYRVKYIAEGGFGKVYEVVITPANNAPIGEFSTIAKVLVKVPKGDFSNESIQKLIMNAKLLSKSPYFLGVLGLLNNRAASSKAEQGMDTEHPVILLEKGLEDLNSLFVEEDGRIKSRNITGKPQDEITVSAGWDSTDYPVGKLLKEMAGGIAFMHKNNLAHLDLKPQNMLMGVDSLAKIIDTDDAVEISGPTTDYPGGSFSVPFTPPERAKVILEIGGVTKKGIRDFFKKTPSIDWRKADVYALGLSMLSIVTGISATKLILWGLNCFAKPEQNLLERFTSASDNKCKLTWEGLFPLVAKGTLNSTLAKTPLPRSNQYKPLYDLLVKMLEADPAKRPSIEQVQAELNKIYP